MESINIRDEDVVELESIAPDLSGLRILFVNVFAVHSSDSWVLVDAGLYLSAKWIQRWAAREFGSLRPKAIILTHAHFDHAGALEDLAKEWDVPVYAHPLEVPHITGKAKYPPPDPSVGGGLMAVLSPLYSRGPSNVGERAKPLPGDGSVPHLPDWRCIPTPGHTDGHVSFFRESDRTLLVGDAFCTTDQESFLAVAQQKPELHGPPAYYTTNWDAARDSVRKLAALHPLIIAPGHGQPIVGEDAAVHLAELAQRFDEIARPHKGDKAA